MKATAAKDVVQFTDIPNIGPAMVKDFAILGITEPHQLARQDAYAIYQKLNNLTHTRHDPCVLDTFLAAVDFMQGAKAKPWWEYTEARKKRYPTI